MQNEGDHRGAHSVEDRFYRGEAAKVDVKRAEHGDDDEVRQNEGPAACPRTPEAPANIGDPDADLDSQRPRERLTDRDAFAHLLLGQPLPLPDQFPLHLAHESDGTAEADRPKAEVVADEFSNGDAPHRLLRFHYRPPR